MLRNINIRNYAIIDQLELEFGFGLTALTGETGAGKSILLGALGLVLGDRADIDSIKQGNEFAEISAEFDILKLPDASAWLQQQELNADDECILRRRIAKDGRSRAYINSIPVTLQLMRQLGEMLIDIHGQHEHQSMMKAGVQRQLLDDYAAHAKLTDAVSTTYKELKAVEEHLNHLQQASNDRTNRLDLLRFQTQELDTLALEENEYTQLDEKHARLANADRLITTVQKAIDDLHDNDELNIQSGLNGVIASLQSIIEFDDQLAPVNDLLQEAQVQIEESSAQLRLYVDSLDSDPAELANVEQRLQAVLDLSRKHHVEPKQLHDLHQQLSTELSELDHADEKLDELQAQYQALEQSYQQIAEKLSASRSKAATGLNKKITAAMQTLGMKGGVFKITVDADDKQRAAHGIDRIEFTVSANAGQNCKPLARVASGGELARISLAIQMITASQGRIPTLIFDEVDSGVGGGVAEIVGQHLRTLGSSNQVVCITHLPQVASQAHHHMRVHKQSDKKQTQTQVDPLNQNERIEEIARMLSGVDITQQSLAHAEEMIARANDG